MQSAPAHTETIGITSNGGSWIVGFFSERVSEMWNDNGSLHRGGGNRPLFVNYTVRGSSRLAQSRIAGESRVPTIDE